MKQLILALGLALAVPTFAAEPAKEPVKKAPAKKAETKKEAVPAVHCDI